MSLRSTAAGCLSVALLAAAPSPDGMLPSRYELRARSVVFDLDSRIATALVGASLQTQNLSVTSDAMSFDLRNDTLLADGNVVVRCATTSATLARLRLRIASHIGDALASALAKPQRFDTRTCTLRDDAHVAAIAAPSTVSTPSSLRARHVEIMLDSYIHLFNPSFGTGAGAVRLPSYSIELGDGPRTQQPAPDAAAQPLIGLVGAPGTLTDARLRLDPNSGIGVGFTEHIASSARQSTAIELSTANIGLRGDLLQNWQITPHVHESLSAAWFKAYVGGRFGIDGTSGAFPFALSIVQNNNFETADAVLASPHETLGTYGRFVREWVDLGYDRAPGQPVPFDARATAGILFDTGRISGPRGVGFDVSADARAAAFSTGERHEIADLSFSATEPLTRRFRLTEQATITPEIDRIPAGVSPLADPNAYISPIADPLFIPTNSGVNVSGTMRSLTLVAHYEPHPGITLETSITRAFDSVASAQTVRPPVSGWFYLHAETPAHFGIEIGRSDLFGWQGVHMVPNYTLRITTPR